jgi:hypothetical protein
MWFMRFANNSDGRKKNFERASHNSRIVADLYFWRQIMAMFYGSKDSKRADGKQDHSGFGLQTQKGLIELDQSGGQQPAPPPIEPKYKTGSDQGKVTNESGLRASLKARGLSDSEVDRMVSQHKAQTGLR